MSDPEPVWCPDAVWNDTRVPCLSGARRYSGARIADLSAALAAADDVAVFETVAVAGSLARLEASPQSDVDCLLVARGDVDEGALRDGVERVMEIVSAAGLKAPKSDGIFRQTTTRAELLDPAALGSLTESPAVFGKRMQFLLDARPLLHAGACRRLQGNILEWYGSGFHQRDANASWTYLLNDVTRYLHAYAAWQQYKLQRSSDDSWQLRQVKLRSSRIVTFAGLLLLLGASNHRFDKQQWLLARLQATPLERIVMIMQPLAPQACNVLLRHYESVLAALSDRARREALVAGGPDSLATLSNEYGADFEAIRAAGDAIMQILTDFILDRRGQWDRRFFSRLIL